MTGSRPNVLLLVMDCARSDQWLGPGRATVTPTFDRLTREGVSLPTTIAETPCTTPCFASLLTGAYSFHHGICGVGGYRLAEELTTLPEVLRENGYRTYMEATGPLLPLTGMTRGFDEYNYRVAVEYLDAPWGAGLLERLRGGAFQTPWFLVLHLWELHLPRQVSRPFRSRRYGRTPYERAVSSLDAQLARLLDAAGPGTLAIITGDHGEKTSAEAYRPGTAVYEAARLYGADRSPRLARLGPHWLIGPVATQQLRARFQPRLESFSQRETPRRVAHGRLQRLRDTWTLLKLAPALRWRNVWQLRKTAGRAELAADSDTLDVCAARERLDRLVSRMGEDALFDVYLRIWAGMLGLHLLAGHLVHVYDFLVRVPLVLHWPGCLSAGTSNNRMVRQVDIAATLLELLGLRLPPGFSPDGRSLAPLLKGREYTPAPAYLSVGGQPRDLTLRGVRTESHKLTYGSADDSIPVELYDLHRDPCELSNLANDEPALVARLRRLTEEMIPAGGPRVVRIESSASPEQVELEKRLRDLGYV